MRRSRNSHVEIFPDRVEKYTSTPGTTAEKYAAVHEIGVRHGFIAPRVLGTRPGCVLLERVDNIVSLRDLYTSRDAAAMDRAIVRAGEVLALLHTHLRAANCEEWRPSLPFLESLRKYSGARFDIGDCPRAILHGDYSFANVFVSGGAPDAIVVLDPCPNLGSTFHDWSIGPVYVDIGKMIACLEGQIPLARQHRRPSPQRISALQRHFVTGYAKHGSKVKIEMAHAFAFAVASAQFRRRFGHLSPVLQVALYNRFRGNFPVARKMQHTL